MKSFLLRNNATFLRSFVNKNDSRISLVWQKGNMTAEVNIKEYLKERER